ncbi:MAG: 4-(cytidine 5'-diphospho)-2-C-methyl-D-erythritol kinase [Hydrogenophaga sp.]
MNAPLPTPTDHLRDVPAPAKLNLFLHINGRRPDGYHLLQSVFMLIDWSDTLHFQRLDDGQICRIDTAPDASLPAEDLTVRAARLLQQATGCRLGVQITLDKHIPAEAGMGGGSSDAASTLIALNRLWQLGLSRAQLAHIGLQLGADVPFFVHGRNAWVEGVGESITPVHLPTTPFVVVKPPEGVSTQRIFTSPDLQRSTKTATMLSFAANGSPGKDGSVVLDLAVLLKNSHNDLEPVAQALCPAVGECIRWLKHQGLQARMTGSGSAVFAPLWTPQKLAPAVPGWTVRECSNQDVHPLLGW